MNVAQKLAAWLLEDAGVVPRLRRLFPVFTEEQIRLALEADPSGGSYTEWILRQVSRGTIREVEDYPKTRELLELFSSLKAANKVQEKNLYAYHTYADLAKAIRGKSTQGMDFRKKADEGAVLIKEHGELALYRLDTAEASKKLCSGTEWCIRFSKMYDQYAADGPVMVLLKNGAPYMGFAPKSQQAVDVYDQPVSLKMCREVVPILKEFLPRMDVGQMTTALHRHAVGVEHGLWHTHLRFRAAHSEKEWLRSRNFFKSQLQAGVGGKWYFNYMPPGWANLVSVANGYNTPRLRPQAA